MLAGWLFADLFLVLFIVALAATPSASLTVKPRPPKPVPSQQAVPAKPAKPELPGMTNTPTNFCVSQGSRSVVTAFDAQVQLTGMAGHKVGFILVFATGTDPGAAVTKAAEAFSLIKSADPDKAALASAGGEGLWGGESNSCRVNGGTDNYHFQVFFYS
jgi:hypothetical protein